MVAAEFCFLPTKDVDVAEHLPLAVNSALYTHVEGVGGGIVPVLSTHRHTTCVSINSQMATAWGTLCSPAS